MSGFDNVNKHEPLLETSEQIRLLKEFIEQNYHAELLETTRKGKESLIIDFSELIKFNTELIDELVERPEEVLKAGEIAIKEFDLPKKIEKFNLRLKNLPDSLKIIISAIRSKHLGKFIWTEGIVRQKSNVRPHVATAKFECPSCGNILSVLQLDQKYKEPTRCSCGRKGKFREISKELVDGQGLVLEESPDDLDGAQPKRINVFLKGDLVSPITERKSSPGTKVRLYGWVSEVPITLRSGGQSTKFDLILEANYIEPVEDDPTDMKISEEDRKAIMAIAHRNNAHLYVSQNLAPSIYGHDKIKEALVLQLAGGCQKKRPDGVSTRGDLHMLLIGDPGAGKCVTGDTLVTLASGKKVQIKDLENDQNELISIDLKNLKAKPAKKTKFFKREVEKILKITTESKKYLKLTPEHPLLTKEGWKEVEKLQIGSEIATLKEETIGESVTWEKVTSIETINKKTKVYDLTVPGPHNFIANGIVAHNSQLLKRITRIAPKARFTSGKGASAAGLCISPNSVVETNNYNNKNGSITTIKSFVENNFENAKLYKPGIWKNKYNGKTSIKTLNKNNKIETKSPSTLWKLEAPKTVNKITLKSKKSIEITDNTKLLTKKNEEMLWAESINLKINDLIATPNYSKDDKNNIFWDQIKTIEKIKPDYKYVYDLTVDDTHSFIANGIFVHNTASVVKDEFLGGWSLEAGTLVLANHGFAIIDELDKMTKEDRSALHEAMEQQSYHYDTEFMFSDGSTQKIGEIVDNLMEKNKKDIIQGIDCEILKANLDILSTDFKKVFHTKSDRISRHTAPDHFIKISFSNGRSIKVTPEHPIFIKDNNKITTIEARNAKVNLEIPAPKNLDPKTKNNLKYYKITKVQKIANKDQKWVYDITVEPNHTFVSEGIFLHNTVSVSKANIQATLKCETSLLAAANPKFGRFDPYDLIANQINLPPTLINRFDLIFPVKDLPSREKDEKMASFILSLHKSPERAKGDIDSDVLKKYFMYIRKKAVPDLTDEAIDEIKKYYISMRNSGGEDEAGIKSIPISARQLEALVRLSEASAKVRFAKEVKREDAQKAIELVDYSLNQIAKDSETGKIDIDRISSRITATQRSTISLIKEIISSIEKESGQKIIPTEAIVQKANEKNISEEDVEKTLSKLRRSGDIFEPKRGFIQRL